MAIYPRAGQPHAVMQQKRRPLRILFRAIQSLSNALRDRLMIALSPGLVPFSRVGAHV